MKLNDIVDKMRSGKRHPARGGNGGELARGETLGAEDRELLEQRPVCEPAFDAYENDQEWLLRADVPGARPDNTTLTWDEKAGLTVHVRPALQAQEGMRLLVGDLVPADWYCNVPLPSYVDASAASSNVSRGVLTVRVPKRQAAKARGIPIEFQP